MKLISLRLENFRCLRDFTFEPNGEDVAVIAQNGIGKSTLKQAVDYLFFGKATEEIIPLDADNKQIPNLTITVEAVFETEKGRLTLTKVQSEDWTPSRGLAATKKKGNSCSCKVNGVSGTAEIFEQFIKDHIGTPNQLRSLTDPTYFPAQMKWEDRRRVLLHLAGDITDADVIASVVGLKDLPAILGAHTVDEKRVIIKSEIKGVKADMTDIQPRIDEVRKGLPVLGLEYGEHDQGVALCQADLKILQEKRASLSAGGAIADKNRELAEVETEIINITNRLKTQGNPERDKAFESIREKERAIYALETEFAADNRSVESKAAILAEWDDTLAQLRAKHATEKDKAITSETSCPACGQDLPEEKVQAAQEAFNESKAQTLAKIRDAGQKLKAERDKLDAEIEELKINILAKDADLQALKDEKAAIVIPEAETINEWANPEYKALQSKANALSIEIEKLGDSIQPTIAQIDTEIEVAQAKLNEANAHLAQKQQLEAGNKRIKQLEAQQKELAVTHERLERELYLTEEFTRAKVSMLDEKINSHFALTSFRLFRNNISNDGLEERCDVLWKETGAPPSAGQLIRIGLDIIRVLSDHLGCVCPIWVDGAESVTEFPETPGQQIRLIHPVMEPGLSEEDKVAFRKRYSQLVVKSVKAKEAVLL